MGADLQQSSPAKKRKACAFLCGAICFETEDPCNKNRDSIRWAYDVAKESRSSGEGANDWYCERVWAEEAAATEHRDRVQFQSDLSKDRDKLSAFLDRRQKVIERTLAKMSSEPKKRRGGVKRVSVHSAEFKRRYLEKPSDNFWPILRYRKRFGSPIAEGEQEAWAQEVCLRGPRRCGGSGG